MYNTSSILYATYFLLQVNFLCFHIYFIRFVNMDKLSEFFQNHRAEIAVFGLSTLIAQFVLRSRNKKSNHPKSEELENELKQLRQKKYQSLRRKSLINIPLELLQSGNSLVDEVQYLCGMTSKIHPVPHLIQQLGLKEISKIVNPLLRNQGNKHQLQSKAILPKQSFVYKGSYILTKNTYSSTKQLSSPIQWLLAGPRRQLYFKPSNVKAAIVTCGGLCPGLNVVIRELYVNLNIHYGCPQVWGIHFGYQGIYSDNWQLFTYEKIRNLQFLGGTNLGSSRGGFDADKMIKGLLQKGINQLYVIGGDGTQRGVHVLHQQIQKRKLQISLVGIPKTIDNDIPIIDKSFGFQTSVSESIRAIRSAYVESTGVQNGIGLVRLMGRDAGYIAMEATNASRDVDVCLIPQNKFNIYGEFGLLEYIFNQLRRKKHMVIVVAEGAGNGVQDIQALKENVVKDDSGNKKLPDIGAFLKNQIVKYCSGKGLKVTLKYIDPTYMIRTVPANAHDVRMCAQLAAAAVHGGMAGFTGFMVGHVNQSLAMIPVSQLFGKQGVVDIKGRTWQRLLAGTGQPEFRDK